MRRRSVVKVLLALDAGVRETGWAVLNSDGVADSGMIGLKTRRPMEPEVRISHMLAALGQISARWDPNAVVHSQPTGINWPVPALELLDSRLLTWASELGLALTSYTAQEVRVAVTGHPNSSKEELGYATMLLLGLIGQGRSSHEWEAIAVGHHHLCRLANQATHLN